MRHPGAWALFACVLAVCEGVHVRHRDSAKAATMGLISSDSITAATGPAAPAAAVPTAPTSTGATGSATGATGATGAAATPTTADPALVPTKGKPLLQLCISERGITAKEAEDAAKEQETAIMSIINKALGFSDTDSNGPKLEFEEVVPFDPTKDKLDDICAPAEPTTTTTAAPVAATGAMGGAPAQGPAATGPAAPAAGPTAAPDAAAPTTVGTQDPAVAAPAVAGFAGGLTVFKAPRNLQHVLSAEDFGPNFIEVGGDATGSAGATGAAKPAAADAPYLIIRLKLQINELKKPAEAQSKAITAFLGEQIYKEERSKILTTNGFPAMTIGLAKPITIDRVEPLKKKVAPKKVVLKKKAGAAKASLPLVSMCVAVLAGLWVAGR